MKEQINRYDLVYESRNCIYDFRKFRTIRSFGDSIFSGKITINEVKQSNLLNVILNFNIKLNQEQKQVRRK